MTGDSYVGAIDQGTTGTRFMVFDHSGRVVASAYERHEQYYPEPGWVEHDPSELWANTKTVVRRALAAADLGPDDLAALGVANQRETTVLWDAETGDPVHNAVVWQDRRTTGRVDQLREDGWAEYVRETTGLRLDAYFSGTKLEWLLDNADPVGAKRGDSRDVRERAEDGDVLFGTVDSWLVYKLTGAHVTDVSNASRTMLLDVH
ncbi:MAG: FGGY family carbohydrate kinase, partial [Halobacterium sp.]